MAENVDDLTIRYEEDGIEIVKELDKKVLSKGAWATVIYKYQDWDRQKEKYSDPRFTMRRYRKMSGDFRQQSKFNISSVAQAEKVIEALQGWIGDSK